MFLSVKMVVRIHNLLTVLAVALISTVALGLKIDIPAHIEDVFLEAREVAASGRDALFEFIPEVKQLRPNHFAKDEKRCELKYVYIVFSLFVF